jgi:hypothetical protein
MIDTGLLFSAGLTTFSLDGVDATRTALSLSPTLACFFVDHIFAQVSFQFDHVADEGGPTYTTLGGGLGIGYDVDLGTQTSLLPAVSVLLNTTDVNRPGVQDGSYSYRELLAVLTVHLLYHPAPHFFFGFGPSWSFSLQTKLSGKRAPSVSRVGADGIIGVWW